ncbi:MAG: NADH:flavin oxidoreductase [Desulfarculus sp.]|nr:NADH:flavin oxidoreductase [Desulfarculus sp.]
MLFTPARINTLEVPNRFVRSATYDGGAEPGGIVSDWQMELYRALAQGGVGLIVSGIFHVTKDGRISPVQNGLFDDRFIPGLTRLAQAAHAQGAKLAVQLFHAGRETHRWKQYKGETASGPSALAEGQDPYFAGACLAMGEDDIWATVEAFGQAARRAKEAGCDGVQLHGAHAYLLAQFLSPQANRRQDAWGGGLEGRLRLHQEIYHAVRQQVGPDFPVMIKLGLADGFAGGLELAEGLEAASRLAALGFDAIEVSQGLRGAHYAETEFRDRIVKREREGYFRGWARQVKQHVAVPVMAVGGYRSLDLIQEVVASGDADFVALSRPLIREPDLVASWRAGEERRPTCISCNKCFENLLTGARLRCMVPMKGEALNRQ